MSVHGSNTIQLIALAVVVSTLGVLLTASNSGQACVDAFLNAQDRMRTGGVGTSGARIVTFAGIIH